MIDFSALADRCDRCHGRHTTTLHFARKIAAKSIARGDTVEQAATASRMPASIVSYWVQADREFRDLVERRRLHHLQKSTKNNEREAPVTEPNARTVWGALGW